MNEDWCSMGSERRGQVINISEVEVLEGTIPIL